MSAETLLRVRRIKLSEGMLAIPRDRAEQDTENVKTRTIADSVGRPKNKPERRLTNTL